MSKFFAKAGLLTTLVAMVLSGAGMSAAFAAETDSSLQAEQSRSCTGIVLDETGAPAIGVTVVVKGTLKGTVTDVDGRFTLLDVHPGDVIQVSSIGYLTQEAVWNGTPLRFTIEEDRLSLEESVVVGYGVQKKVNVTGAVSMVDSEALESRPVQNVQQALQGQIPGLNLTVNGYGGELNNTMDFSVRGGGTIGSGSNGGPLVLIDGIEGSMNTVNANDIETISVLKDAASSSIYGSRAAFGVILITTKSGKAGKTHVSYSGDVRFSSALHVPSMVSGLEFAEYFNVAAINSGSGAVFSDEKLQRFRDYAAGIIKDGTTMNESNRHWNQYTGANASTDWYDEYYNENVPTTQHNISINGGNDIVNYRLSGSFLDQKGLLAFGEDRFKRYTIDSKISTKLASWARLNYTAKWTREDYSRPTYIYDQGQLFFHNIIRRWPTNPVYDPNGYLLEGMETIQLRDGGETTTQKNYYTNQVALVLEPVKNWKINLEGNMRRYNSDTHYVVLPCYAYDADEQPYAISFDGNASYAKGQTRVGDTRYREDYYTTNLYTDYTLSLNEAHNFHFLAGFNAELTQYDSVNGRGDSLVDSSVPYLSQTTTLPKVGSDAAEFAVAGFFGRVNYNFKDRYMLELNARYDGSSRFVGEKQWGFFPSVSAGWNIAKEPFFGNLSNSISTLKLRASWGQLGNTNTSAWYPFYQTLSTGSGNSAWVIDGERQNTASMPGIVSSALTWETVESIDFGLDLIALDGRLDASFDWFTRTTRDMVGPAPELSSVLGTSAPKINNCDLKSVGFELELGWRDRIGDFNYGVKLVMSDAKRTVLSYPNVSKSLSTYYDGMELGEIWGYESYKIASSLDEMNGWIATNKPTWGSNWGAGDMMYKDQNGDGIVNTGANTADDSGDRKVIGNSTPRYNYGFTIDLGWKGIDLKAFLQGVGKRDIYLSGPVFFGSNAGMWQCTVLREHLDYWSEDNLDAYYTRPLWAVGSKNTQTQTHFLQNAAYLRLKNLQIGYTLPSKWTDAINVGSVRFYVSGDNLFTLTKMTTIFDPETTGGGWGNGKLYPLMKTYAFGVNINF